MAVSKSMWGIDIGQCALKALKLHDLNDGTFHVEAFEVIEHEKVLSEPEADAPALIRASLEEFLRRQDVSDSQVAVSVLGQSSFTKFVKLPPVEEKRIPEIVRFEAEQQIPFPIDEVSWRYQTFQDPDSPEVEVGLFAVKKLDVAEMLAYYNQAEVEIDLVQMAPLSLYNFMVQDNLTEQDSAVLLADVGADKTHLVIADGGRIWTRTIMIGGNRFTEALVKSFNLSFDKAEKLKRTAASSKYARQIFQVMRPVFAELVQDIQRSIGYYKTLHREAQFTKLVGMGNGFRLPGMQKYLEQNLNMTVACVEKFNHVQCDSPNFNEFALSFGVAYGLAAQGLGYGAIQTNLLPPEIIKQRLWGKKKLLFALSAAALIVGALALAVRGQADLKTLKQGDTTKAGDIVKELSGWKEKQNKIAKNLNADRQAVLQGLSLRAYADTFPEINSRIANAVNQTLLSSSDVNKLQSFASQTPEAQAKKAAQLQTDHALMLAISSLPWEHDNQEPTEGGKLRKELLKRLSQRSRTARRLLIFDGQRSRYIPDLEAMKTADGPRVPDNAMMEAPGRAPVLSSSRSRQNRGRKPLPQIKTVRRGLELTLTGHSPMDRGSLNDVIARLKGNLAEQFAEPKVQEGQSPAAQTVALDGEIEVSYPQNEGTGREAVVLRPSHGRPRMDVGLGVGGTETSDKPQVSNPDPLFPEESQDTDVRFQIKFYLKVIGNGVVFPESFKQEDSSESKGSR